MENKQRKAYYHLPGLFEFYELYRVFLPLFFNHREYFFDWCAIGSIYGTPMDCIWAGGRIENGEVGGKEVIAFLRKYGIPARLTFSNSLLQEEHLADADCNEVCRLFAERKDSPTGIIIHSDLLMDYLKKEYPEFYYVSSTTKVLTGFDAFAEELKRREFRYVVPDFRLNKAFDRFAELSQEEKDKVEFLCNECCSFTCRTRKSCYEAVSRKNLGIRGPEFQCSSPDAQQGYRFSKAMENQGFIGIDDIREVYLPLGFSHFKIEGRGLGSALILEFLLYYMTKPEYQLKVREEIYLDNMLDLF